MNEKKKGRLFFLKQIVFAAIEVNNTEHEHVISKKICGSRIILNFLDKFWMKSRIYNTKGKAICINF